MSVIPGETAKANSGSLSSRTAKITLIAFIALLLGVGAYLAARADYLLFHSFADMITVFIAASVFVVVWNSRKRLDNNYYLFVGIAFLFFGFFDFLHLLGNKNMGVFPEYGNLGPTLYIVSRYILSLSLVAAPLFIRRRFNVVAAFAVYSTVSVLLLLSIFYWKNFPVTYVEGNGLTPFKVISDYITCAILAVAIGTLLFSRKYFEPRIIRMFVWALVLSIATGLAFTLYTDPFGIMNLVGHFFQIGSFSLVYFAFVETALTKPQDMLYLSLKDSKEEALRLNAELERLNLELKQEIAQREKVDQIKDEFIGLVSHELRSPLTVVIGALNTAMDERISEDEAKLLLKDAASSAETLSVILDNMLELSRYQAGRLTLARDVVKIEEIAARVAARIGQKYEGHKFVLEIPGISSVRADKVRLEQVLYNLIDNAAKYSPEGSCVRVFGRSEPDNTVVGVSDEGIGISPENQKKLFAPFSRIPGCGVKGIGLGLVVCKRLVEAHGGRMWIESQPSKGSTFLFTLPNPGV